jgi:hypothetical protein
MRMAVRLDPKGVAMLAEIFMLRLEAERRLVQEVLPSSISRFTPIRSVINLSSRKRSRQMTLQVIGGSASVKSRHGM